jgi:hypothetical protein
VIENAAVTAPGALGDVLPNALRVDAFISCSGAERFLHSPKLEKQKHQRKPMPSSAWPTLSLVWLIGAYALVFGVPLLVSATRFKNALGGIPEPAAAV